MPWLKSSIVESPGALVKLKFWKIIGKLSNIFSDSEDATLG